VRPFTDLRDPSVLLAEEQGNILQQLVSLSLFAASGLYLLKNWQIALKMLSPLLILLLGWQFVTVFTSDYSAIAFRRYIFSITAIVTAMAWVILPENTQHFQKMIKYLSLFILLLSYFGVIFMPEISIHNMAEVLELVNAGSWRGHFAHKNIAGPAMIVLIIYNLYLLRKEDFLIPAINIILATIFLIYSNNKTSIGLILIALLVAQLIRTVRILPLQLLAFFIPIILMAALTVGTVINPSLYDFVSSAISDPSFTGRTDIWKFAFEQLRAHPWIGFGFDTFWNMSNLVNGGYDIETWAARAGHAHNGYINLALSSGAIGVILFAIWMLFSPLLDYNRSQKNGNDPALATMYLRIWVFMMLYANLESPFFAPRGQVWFSLLAAVLALRLHARVKIR
jgi:O-antigen ligase